MSVVGANYHFSYFVGSLIFLVAWILSVVVYRSGRHEMIIGSALAAPFAFSGFLFIPQYWTPPSLFNLDATLGIGIEDVLWSWCVGGLASVAGQILLKEKLTAAPRIAHHTIVIPLAVVMAVFVTLQIIYPHHAVNNLIAGFLCGSALVLLMRRDLLLPMVFGAAAFTILYLALFLILLLLYPRFILTFYNLPNLSGLYIFGVPIEELEFAFSGGSLWAAMNAYSKGLRVSS